MSNLFLRDAVPELPSLAPIGDSLQSLMRRLPALWRLERIRRGRRAAVRAAAAEGLDPRMFRDIGIGSNEVYQPRRYVIDRLSSSIND